MRTLRRRAATLATAAVIPLTLAACGGDDDMTDEDMTEEMDDDMTDEDMTEEMDDEMTDEDMTESE